MRERELERMADQGVAVRILSAWLGRKNFIAPCGYETRAG